MNPSARVMQTWGGALLDFLYPRVCPLCALRLDEHDDPICYRCRATLGRPPQWRCERCGAGGFGGEPNPTRRCRLCPPADAHYQGVMAVAGYGGDASRCVQLFKYHRRVELGWLMARLMCDRLAEPARTLGGRIDWVVPVPLHWLRRMGRGFNQSDLLARTLARALDKPCRPGLLRRRKYKRRQALLPRNKRRDNVRGVFAVTGGADLAGRGILLVDDVITSGYTIDECARVLKHAGAREVWAAGFARAGMGFPDQPWH